VESFSDFKKAVIKVYKSVESEHAISHRKSYGIEKEEM
jgi:hypothetical protein